MAVFAVTVCSVFATQNRIFAGNRDAYIYEHKEWPFFSWDKELVGEKLNQVNKAVGYLMGRLSVIGFNDRMSAVVESISYDIIASSEIEGEELNDV